jgi:hypothetical protein
MAAGLVFGGQSRDGIVKVEAGVNPLRLVRGEEGKIILKITVKNGIVVSPQPSFIIEFEPNDTLVFPKPFYTASDLNVDIVDDKGREGLSFKKPLEIPFTVAPKASRGVHVLHGKVKFYAISKSEGWCLKSTARFRATYSTRTGPVKIQL